MKTAAFVYARMDSTRLPGKALKPIGGRPMIDVVLDRALGVGVDTCVLLTTSRSIDDPLVEHVEERGVQVIRGSTEDLVARTLLAVETIAPTRFFRVNGDSPLFDCFLMKEALLKMGKAKLVSNLFQRTFPYGVAVELFDTDYYVKNAVKVLADEKEHVTKHLYRTVEKSDQLNMWQERDDSALQLSVDTLDDHRRIDEILANGNRSKSYWNIYNLEKPSLVFE